MYSATPFFFLTFFLESKYLTELIRNSLLTVIYVVYVNPRCEMKIGGIHLWNEGVEKNEKIQAIGVNQYAEIKNEKSQ